MKEILKELRKYEIKIRKAINSQMQGDYQSIFKGSGLEFDDVRPYQWGDDVRTIDWKTSAKGHGTFVKTYIEDKEQTVFFIVDVSASQEIGKKDHQKIDRAKKIAGVLALAAIKESSKVGLMCYSDELEYFLKPNKGTKHAYEFINKLFSLKPKSKKTNLDASMKTALELVKKKSVIFLISDFIDEDYYHNMKGIARKHDLIAIQIADSQEGNVSSLGIVPLLEKETGKTVWINSSSKKFKTNMSKSHSEGKQNLQDFCRRNNVNYLCVDTHEDYASKLIKLFRHRNLGYAKK